MNKYYLPHSAKCFVCGSENEVGLKCRFYTNEKGAVYTEPTLPRRYAGFTDVVHGGIQSSILDEALGWCGFTGTDLPTLYFTRELNVKFRKNVMSDVPFRVEARITDVKRGLVYSTGEIKDEAGNVLTTASGVFVPLPAELMHSFKNELLFIDDGRPYLQKALDTLRPKGKL